MGTNSQTFPGKEVLIRLLSKSSPLERRRLLKVLGKKFPKDFPFLFKETFQAEDIQFFNEKQLLNLADELDNTTIALNIYELPVEFQDYFLSMITKFKAKEIRYILNNFSKAYIHKEIPKAKEYLQKFITKKIHHT